MDLQGYTVHGYNGVKPFDDCLEGNIHKGRIQNVECRMKAKNESDQTFTYLDYSTSLNSNSSNQHDPNASSILKNSTALAASFGAVNSISCLTQSVLPLTSSGI